MFKKLISKLYQKYCDPDVAAMTRMQLGYFNEPDVFEDLTDKQREIHYDESKRLKENKTLNYIFDKLVSEVKDSVWHKSVNEHIIYDRFTLNGIYMVKERLEALAVLGKEEEEKYDKHSII